jgi:hypothetical protein
MMNRHFGLAAAGVASAALTLTMLGATAASAAPAEGNCGGNPYHLRVLQAVDASAAGRSLTAQNTKYVCGDDDGQFIPVGKAKKFTFAPGVKATLLNRSRPQAVSLTDLLRRVHLCRGNPGAVPYPGSCRSQYVITVNKTGAITSIAQRYQP